MSQPEKSISIITPLISYALKSTQCSIYFNPAKEVRNRLLAIICVLVYPSIGTNKEGWELGPLPRIAIAIPKNK